MSASYAAAQVRGAYPGGGVNLMHRSHTLDYKWCSDLLVDIGHPVRRLSRGASPSRSSQPLPRRSHRSTRHARWPGAGAAPGKAPAPCSPIAVSSPNGSSFTKSHAHAASHARLTWSSFASGAANATFSRTVPANRKLSCGTYANAPAGTWDAAHDAPSSSSYAKPSAS